MDRQVLARTVEPAAPRFNDHPVWLLILTGLMAWQGWMALSLFAPPDHLPNATTLRARLLAIPEHVAQCWQRLGNDEPIVSGRHPFHLYFGYLGAQSFYDRGTFCCYEPAFQIGFPKTPVFDSGSRPAELFLTLAGGEFRPEAYKIGLALCCFLVPALLALAGFGLGLGRGFTCLAVVLGLLLCWSSQGRAALEDGELDLVLASLASLAHLCLLIQYDRRSGFWSWLGLLVTGCIGWFAQPVIFLLLVPLVLLYYLGAGVRHTLNWHLALLASLVGALALNSFWLIDWTKYWWIRLPIQIGSEPLRHRTLQTIWSAPLWGDASDRAFSVALVALAFLGVVILNQTHQRSAARLLGLAAGGFLALAVAGIATQPLGRMGAAQLLLPALWYATMPAVFAVAQLCRAVNRLTGWSGTAAFFLVTLLAGAAYQGSSFCFPSWQRAVQAPSLTLGLGAERTALVDVLRQHVGPESRILWEDRPAKKEAPRWSALLPVLTERAYVGGLDPQSCIEHSYASLNEHNLAGRPIAEWSDSELDDFCRRYNIGWTVCWSPDAVARLRSWKQAQEIATVEDEGTGHLFRLPPRSFILKGQARWLCASRHHITLADVVPDDGVVLLSLHYQTGLQASPGRVQIEREPDPFDPIPFVRLRVPGPVARVTIIWDDH